jgi:hypothetical protein
MFKTKNTAIIGKSEYAITKGRKTSQRIGIKIITVHSLMQLNTKLCYGWNRTIKH